MSKGTYGMYWLGIAVFLFIWKILEYLDVLYLETKIFLLVCISMFTIANAIGWTIE